jgi:hypothetical protein
MKALKLGKLTELRSMSCKLKQHDYEKQVLWPRKITGKR